MLACSALKRSYRDRLRRADAQILFVLLNGLEGSSAISPNRAAGSFHAPLCWTANSKLLKRRRQMSFALAVDVALTPDQMVEQIIAHVAALEQVRRPDV